MSLNDLTPRQRAQNATKLSAWLYVHEPALFRQLLVTLPRLQRSPLGRLGLFGDDSGLSEVVVSAPDASSDFISSGGGALTDIAPDLSSFKPDLTPIGVDTSLASPVDTAISSSVSDAVASAPVADSSVADSSSTSGGFWGSLGAGLGSAAGAIGKVAGALISPPAIAAAGTAAAAYFGSQAASAQRQAQQAAVQLQLQRTALGATPAAVTYARNPYTGAITPVYQSNSGSVPLTQGLYNQLSNPGLPGGTVTWIALAGGALLLVLLASR